MTLVETTGFEIVPLSEDEARDITNKIRQNVALAWVLVEKAHKGRVWIVLGYSSWDEYCDAEFDGAYIRVPREDREIVLPSMAAAGMSVRAIASATGLSKSTVARGLAGVPFGTPAHDEADLSGVGNPTPDEPTPADLATEEQIELLVAATDDEFEAALDTSRAEGDISIDNVLGNLPTTTETTETDTKVIAADTGEVILSETTTTTRTVTGLDGKTYKPKSKPAERRRKALPDQIDKASRDMRKAAERLVQLAADDRFTANKKQVAALIRSHLTFTVEVCQDLLDLLDHQ